jgi:hypothetical protein
MNNNKKKDRHMYKLYIKRTVERIHNIIGYDWILDIDDGYILIEGYDQILSMDFYKYKDEEFKTCIEENYDLWCVSDKITLHVNYHLSELVGKLPKHYQ